MLNWQRCWQASDTQTDDLGWLLNLKLLLFWLRYFFFVLIFSSKGKGLPPENLLVWKQLLSLQGWAGKLGLILGEHSMIRPGGLERVKEVV